VWVTPDEIRELAAAMHLGLDDFGRRYLRRVGLRYALLERPGGDCVFLQGRACAVYDRRPAQCRSFPFWPANLRSPDAWARAAGSCEGIAADAPLVTADVIERELAAARESGLTADDPPQQDPSEHGAKRRR
jgi:Fe-S-cluster containining protein